jgi:hypothetical protein
VKALDLCIIQSFPIVSTCFQLYRDKTSLLIEDEMLQHAAFTAPSCYLLYTILSLFQSFLMKLSENLETDHQIPLNSLL